MPDTPLNPDDERQCVELLLEYRGTPMHRLYEYPHRADDSDRYIANAKSLLAKILAVAQPEVTSVEVLDAAIKRAGTRAFDFMDQTNRGEFSTDGELFEHAFACGVQAVREEATRPEVKP